MKPKFSVVIPAYNCENVIIDALNSVLFQTKLEYIGEIIVVNDGSEDNTQTVIEKYASDKRNDMKIHIINKSNGGVSAARNIGVKRASYEWIAFLDSDDEWYPDKIERQAKIIQELGEEQVDCLGGSFNGDVLSILGKKYTGLILANVKQICLKNFPQPSTAVIKRNVFDSLNGFDESAHYAEDGLLFLQVCAKYKMYYDTNQVISFGHGKRGFGSAGLSGNIKAMHQGNIRNIRFLKESKLISNSFYWFLRVFYELKYLRRVLLSRGAKR